MDVQRPISGTGSGGTEPGTPVDPRHCCGIVTPHGLDGRRRLRRKVSTKPHLFSGLIERTAANPQGSLTVRPYGMQIANYVTGVLL